MFWRARSTTLTSSQVEKPTSPTYSTPGLAAAGLVLPVPGFRLIRKGLRKPRAHTLERGALGLAAS